MAPEEEPNPGEHQPQSSESRDPGRPPRRSGRGRRGRGRRARHPDRRAPEQPRDEAGPAIEPLHAPAELAPSEEESPEQTAREETIEAREEAPTERVMEDSEQAPTEEYQPEPEPETALEPEAARAEPGFSAGELEPSSPPTIQQAIDQVTDVTEALRKALDDMEQVLEMLEEIERQSGADQREIESLRRALRQLHRPHEGGRSSMRAGRQR